MSGRCKALPPVLQKLGIIESHFQGGAIRQVSDYAQPPLEGMPVQAEAL